MRSARVSDKGFASAGINVDISLGVKGDTVVVDCRADRDARVCNGHADGGSQEERPATKAFSQERGADGDGEVPDLQDSVDEGLVEGRGDADTFEDQVEVVRNEAVSTPLTEEPNAWRR